MTGNKTTPRPGSIEAFLAALGEQRRDEARQLIEMMRNITGEEPVMWGTSIIGFGALHYKYASGREGDWMRLGFSPRKAKISLYITNDAKKYAPLLDAMGKHGIGKGCIYINKLIDVDMMRLREVVQCAYREND